MALATVDRLSFSYPGRAPALRDVSLELRQGEMVAVLGPSGSGKSTLVRALAGLVPHFHGGRFEGRVEVDGMDTRRVRPSDLAGVVATVFQDPEDQVVFGRVEDEVAFGLENVGTAPHEIAERARQALAVLGSEHLLGRRVAELSAGELQRVCLASSLALEPQLLLLDEPTSQLDPETADALLRLACGLGVTVVLSEQRPAGPLEVCDRVLFLEEGRVILDARRDEAIRWLARHRPAYLPHEPAVTSTSTTGPIVCRLDGVSFGYRGGPPVLVDAGLELRRGEVVALAGPNGSGKTTLAKVAGGLLQSGRGTVDRRGRAVYLSQDPGRYLVRERVDEEVALAVGGDVSRAAPALAAVGLSGFESRHPRDLSSGERERLALASVLVTEPDLLILDEPTRGVDPERKDELARLLRAQAAQRATLVVTHDLVFAAEVADRTISLGATEPVYV
ncbi:MAG: ATP-binding cassette domain-containing protein [Actinobacteria bacterium]|nr:ATP-binding cassette domain-containing protein [Actinomycetota bacterium]